MILRRTSLIAARTADTVALYSANAFRSALAASRCAVAALFGGGLVLA
jgi:hypothetical protein